MFGIIMSNWNKERYIGQAIDSVLAQTDPDWKLVIVDDGSTDGSMDEIRKRRDPRILAAQGIHQGPGQASKVAMGLIKSRGVDFVGVLDSDDTLHPDAVKVVRQAQAAHPECGLVYTQNWRCGPNLEPIELGRARVIPEGETVLSLHDQSSFLRVNHWIAFTIEAYDRTGGYVAMARHQDMDLIFKLEEATKLYFVDQPLYNYRILEDGLHTGKLVADFAPLVKEAAHARRKARLIEKSPVIHEDDSILDVNVRQ